MSNMSSDASVQLVAPAIVSFPRAIRAGRRGFTTEMVADVIGRSAGDALAECQTLGIVVADSNSHWRVLDLSAFLPEPGTDPPLTGGQSQASGLGPKVRGGGERHGSAVILSRRRAAPVKNKKTFQNTSKHTQTSTNIQAGWDAPDLKRAAAKTACHAASQAKPIGEWVSRDFLNYFGTKTRQTFGPRATSTNYGALARHFTQLLADPEITPEVIKKMIDCFCLTPKQVRLGRPVWRTFLYERTIFLEMALKSEKARTRPRGGWFDYTPPKVPFVF